MNKNKDVTVEVVHIKNWLNKHENVLDKEDLQILNILNKTSFSEFQDNLGYKLNHRKLEDIIIDNSLSDEDKVSYIVALKDNVEGINQFILEGYLLFLGKRYEIKLATIVAYVLLEKYGISKLLTQFIQFLILNNDFDGSVGIINPLRNTISDDIYPIWKYGNTYFSYLFLAKAIKHDL